MSIGHLEVADKHQGANLSFPVEFGIADNGWLVGFINSAPALFGLCTAWAADPVNNLIGRRGTIFATGLFVIFPVLAQAFTHNWWSLLICRACMGFGMGYVTPHSDDNVVLIAVQYQNIYNSDLHFRGRSSRHPRRYRH